MFDRQRKSARKGWVLVLVAVVVGAAVGAVSVFGGESTYTAKATMYVTPPTSSTPTDAVMGDQYALNRAQLYLQLINSNELAQRVAAVLKSSQSPDELAASVEATTLHQAPILTLQAQGTSPDAARSLAQAYVDALPDYAKSVERNSGLREDAPLVPVVLPIEVESNSAGLKSLLRILLWTLIFGAPVAAYVAWSRHRHPAVRGARGLREAIPVSFVEDIGDDPAQSLRIQALLFSASSAARQVVFAGPRQSDLSGEVTTAFAESLSRDGIHCELVPLSDVPNFNVSLHSSELAAIDAPALLDDSHLVGNLVGRFTTAVIVVRRGATLIEDVVDLRKLLALNGIEVKGVIISRRSRSNSSKPVGTDTNSEDPANSESHPWPTIDVLEAEMSGRSNGRPAR